MQIHPVSLFRTINTNFKSSKTSAVMVKPMKADSFKSYSNYKGYTGWLDIPSCNKESYNCLDNVNTLCTYWGKDWDCDRDISSLLWTGDFQIYLDNGTPKVGVKYLDYKDRDKDIVQKIFISRNQDTIPLKVLDELKNHIKGHKVEDNPADLIMQSDELQNKVNNMFPDGVENYTMEEKLNAFGIETALDTKNNFILSEYRQPSMGVRFEDIGINEDDLLANTSTILGNADFTNSSATSLGSVELIGGNVTMKNHNIKDTGKLAHVGGSRDCDDSDFHVAFELKYGIW